VPEASGPPPHGQSADPQAAHEHEHDHHGGEGLAPPQEGLQRALPDHLVGERREARGEERRRQERGRCASRWGRRGVHGAARVPREPERFPGPRPITRNRVGSLRVP
jgi:hypothetical protein